jgi:Sulfotransferase family
VPVYNSVLKIADSVADAVGLLSRPLDADALLALAQRRSGLRDFGDMSFVEPLRRLMASCDDEASLSLVGRMATRWDVLRFLTNLLQFRDAERRDPAILNQPIEQPIFITGLPRTGTTFLHRLLMEDPDNRAPRVWQTIYPYPLGKWVRGRPDVRPLRVARQLRTFEKLAPEFRGLHPLDATSPQECSEITAHVFRSLRFDTTYRIPTYRRWLDGDSHLPAYAFHKRFLQHLQHQASHDQPGHDQPGHDQATRNRGVGRWVVKCPDHLFALAAIRTVYPDARLVFVHRDPVKVLLSVAKLTEVLRRPFTRRIDSREIGTQESGRWLGGAQHMVSAGDDAGLPEPICHVHHKALVADPVGAVAALYQHFGLPLAPSVAASIRAYAQQRPNGGYGPRAYRFEDHGLDDGLEREKFRGYMLRFGVESEHDTDRRPTNPRGAATRPAHPMHPLTT